MSTYTFYITPEEYVEASKNGICKKVLENRVREYGWDKQRAINTPIRKRGNIPERFKELAKANGININTFYRRVCTFKWDMQKAATEPVKDRKTIVLNMTESKRKYPKEYIEKAKENGITPYNFRRRVREYGWSFERAATTPVMTKKEIGLLVKEKFREF